MKHSLSAIWSRALSRITQELREPSFAALSQAARPVAVEDGTLIVEFPNVFTRDWFAARYEAPLRETLRALGKDWQLEFVLPGADAERNGRARKATPSDDWTPQAFTARPSFDNSRYTFDTFVVGPSNHFAHAAAFAVAETPGDAYNPLFIYGGVGLGKTHLMRAIGHYAVEHHPHLRVTYVSSETFTNQLIHALQRKAMAEFRDNYRTVDLLLIDDIQFVAGKESTQEEFFHTFNALYEANKQIVISSDRSPKDIPTLEERLRSRFEWGLTTDIQTPDLETRVAILGKKAAAEGLTVPDDVLHYIANGIQSNIRELEGALIRVLAYAATNKQPITVALASQALKDMLTAHAPRRISIDTIQEVAAAHFGLRLSDMRGKKRTRNLSFPRQLAMYLARELTDASLPRIGDEFGGRDHTTVMHAHQKISSQARSDPSLQATLEELKRKIKGD